MAAVLTADVLQDELAVSLACALTTANRKARESGIDVIQSLITVTQLVADDRATWRVHYGPKNYVGRRGGDLIIDVDSTNASIQRVFRGQ